VFSKCSLMGLLVPAGVLLLAGLWFAFRIDGMTPQDALVIEEPEKDLGRLLPGTHDVDFRVRNTSGKPLRIIGLDSGCTTNCCYRFRDLQQVVVPPHGVAACWIELKVSRPEPFKAQMRLFLEDRGIRIVPITVKGVGIASGGVEE
jgi:hypothetical protein